MTLNGAIIAQSVLDLDPWYITILPGQATEDISMQESKKNTRYGLQDPTMAAPQISSSWRVRSLPQWMDYQYHDQATQLTTHTCMTLGYNCKRMDPANDAGPNSKDPSKDPLSLPTPANPPPHPHNILTFPRCACHYVRRLCKCAGTYRDIPLNQMEQ
jgi:hypothetical protein